MPSLAQSIKRQFKDPHSIGWWAFFAGIALVYHWYSQWDWLWLPLFNDEFYYATPEILGLGIFRWPEYSFGHPPGWHWINWIFYMTFGYSTTLARTVGLIFSSLTLIVFSYWAFRNSRIFLSVFVLLIILGNEYFYIYSAHNQPLLATTLFGFLALFALERRNLLAFFYLVTLSILVRESSLVFLPAALAILPNKKMLRFLLLPIAILFTFYLWSVLALGDSPFNPQMNVVLRSGQSIFIFELNHILRYFEILFLKNLLGFPVFVAFGFICFLRSGFRGNWNTLAIAFLFVFLFDSLFFALYRDQDVRNTLVSTMALMLFTIVSLSDQYWFPKNALVSATLFFAALCFVLFPRPISSQKSEQLAIVEVVKELSPILLQAKHRKTNIDIVSTNPFTQYLRHPYMGMVAEEIPVRWHGGSVGATQIGRPDLLVIPTKGFDNFATRELKAFAENNPDFVKVKVALSNDERVEAELYSRSDLGILNQEEKGQ